MIVNVKGVLNMKKSLYSVILSDEVVAQIDRLAYKSNTNRSNMINQILAEYVSYTTPEKRMSQIFAGLENMLSPLDTFQTLLGNSLSVMNLRSSLDYKYNPSVRYSVELYRTPSDAIGEIKVSLRSQNSTLLLYLLQFYKLWSKIESGYLSDCECMIDGDKYVRKLKLHTDKQVSTEKLGELIANYVKAFDSALKAFFYNIEEPRTATADVEEIYRNYITNCDVII